MMRSTTLLLIVAVSCGTAVPAQAGDGAVRYAAAPTANGPYHTYRHTDAYTDHYTYHPAGKAAPAQLRTRVTPHGTRVAQGTSCADPHERLACAKAEARVRTTGEIAGAIGGALAKGLVSLLLR